MKSALASSSRSFSYSYLQVATSVAACFILALPAQAQDSFNRSGVSSESLSNPYDNTAGPMDITASGSSGFGAARGDMSDDMTGGMVASANPAATANSYQANQEMRLSQIESQMRDMRGQLETKDFEIRQLKERLDKALADIDMRLNSGVDSAAAAASTPAPSSGSSGNLQADDMGLDATPPQPDAVMTDPNAPASGQSSTVQPLGSVKSSPSGVPISPDKSNDAASQYETAYSSLKGGDYKTAQVQFDKFLKANASHPLAANATYWYGETFYAQGKYTESSRVFAESYKKYPKGPKAADSLLKLGMSLGSSGKTKEACVTLKQLKKQFPTGNSTVQSRATQEMTKLSCA